MTAPRLAGEIGWSENTARTVLLQLVALELLEKAPAEFTAAESAAAGPAPVLYVPSDALAAVLNTSFEGGDFSFTAPGLFEHGTPGPLSPPDARLAADMAERRVEAQAEIAAACDRIRREHPEMEAWEVAAQAVFQVSGIENPLGDLSS
jgi:hypothetical protein